MKTYATYALSLFFSFTIMTTFGQTIKPKQFNNFPEVINCSEQELLKVFSASPGQTISLSFSDNFIFSGIVKTNMSKYANLQSAVIVSPDYFNSIFNISKIIKADGSVAYVGHIINKNYFDGFELKKNVAGIYQLKKTESDRVIQDCNLF